MQLFHVMNLMTALVEIHQYIVEESAVLKQHPVTPLILEQCAPNVLVCKSCEIECISLLLLPCLWDNTLSPVQSHNSRPQHDPCTCVLFTSGYFFHVFHSLVHGFECLNYEVSKGFDLRATFRLNVKGTTQFPRPPKLDGKFNLIPVSNSAY